VARGAGCAASGQQQLRITEAAPDALPHTNDTVQLQRQVETYAYDGGGNILSTTHGQTVR
jgi:hypothetical protein